jgi:hypothetical protein
MRLGLSTPLTDLARAVTRAALEALAGANGHVVVRADATERHDHHVVTRPRTGGEVITLVYELLDAHADTAMLAAEFGTQTDARWLVHLDYLRDLQRRGREVLAHHDLERAA